MTREIVRHFAQQDVNDEPPATPEARSHDAERVAIPLVSFVALSQHISAGSEPDAIGLAWLAERDYSTLIDLRDPETIPASFAREALRLRLRHLPLPLDERSVTVEDLDWLQEILEDSHVSRIYLFDRDGRRTGALWYLLHASNQRGDLGIVRDQAEALGLDTPEEWATLEASLQRITAPVADLDDPSRLLESVAGSSDDPTTTTAVSAFSGTGLDPSTITKSSDISTSPNRRKPSTPEDSGPILNAYGWRPMVGLVISISAFPIAYWGGQVVAEGWHGLRRANPVASVPQSPGLPDVSGEQC